MMSSRYMITANWTQRPQKASQLNMAPTTSESTRSRLSSVERVSLNCSQACRIPLKTAASSCGMCRWDGCLRWRISPTCVCIWPATRASSSTGLTWFWTEESVSRHRLNVCIASVYQIVARLDLSLVIVLPADMTHARLA